MAEKKPVLVDDQVVYSRPGATILDVVPRDVQSVTTLQGALIPRRDFARVPVPEGFETNLTAINKGAGKRAKRSSGARRRASRKRQHDIRKQIPLFDFDAESCATVAVMGPPQGSLEPVVIDPKAGIAAITSRSRPSRSDHQVKIINPHGALVNVQHADQSSRASSSHDDGEDRESGSATR